MFESTKLLCYMVLGCAFVVIRVVCRLYFKTNKTFHGFKCGKGKYLLYSILTMYN